MTKGKQAMTKSIEEMRKEMEDLEKAIEFAKQNEFNNKYLPLLKKLQPIEAELFELTGEVLGLGIVPSGKRKLVFRKLEDAVEEVNGSNPSIV